uniref:hypothetical protein n=1 Tax=Bacillus sp. Xin1 TaxID=2740676 RepID=UPI001C2D5311
RNRSLGSDFGFSTYNELQELRKRSETIHMGLANCRAFPHDSLVWLPGQEVEVLWSGFAFYFYLNDFQVFISSKLILEKTLRPRR